MSFLGGGDKNKPAPPPPAPPQEENKRIDERIEEVKTKIAEAKRIEERTEKLKKKAVALVTSAARVRWDAIGTSKELQVLENIYDRLDDLSSMVEVVDKSEAIPWFDSASKAVGQALIYYLEFARDMRHGKAKGKAEVEREITALTILQDWLKANE